MFESGGHHAYLLVGDIEESLRELFREAQKEYGENPESHPDVRLVRGDRLGIGESREIRELQSQSPFRATRRLFVIAAHAFTPEAQNALLKTLEEPAATSRFVIIVPDDRHLLRTLVSRMHRVEGAQAKFEYVSAAKKFLGDAPHERMSFMAELVAGYDEPETKQGVRVRLHLFTDALERTIHERLHDKKATKETRVLLHEALRGVMRVRDYADDPAAALRFVGEHLALAVPTVRG